jgi:hypothetical protein
VAFTWLNKQGVRSDRGFVLQFTGRFTAEYREAGRKITLHVEDGRVGDRQCILVDPNAFDRWDGDPPRVKLPPEETARLFANLREAVEFQGLALVVQEGEQATE